MFGKVKKYRLLVLGLVFFVFGAGALFFSLSSYSIKPANASSSVSENWTISQYRTLKIERASFPQDTQYVSLGPAVWNVAGSSGGTTYTETLTAGGWKQSTNGRYPQGNNLTELYTKTFITDVYHSQTAAPRSDETFVNTGLYSFSWNWNSGTGGQYNNWVHGVSYPSTWTITGTVN